MEQHELFREKAAGASERKIKLFLSAYSRHSWAKGLTLPPSRAAVEAAELFADGGLDRDSLNQAWLAQRPYEGGILAHLAASGHPLEEQRNNIERYLMSDLYSQSVYAHEYDPAYAALLMEDIFGGSGEAKAPNNWLDREGLAAAAYEERLPGEGGGLLDPVRLAVLADYLEEQGMADGVGLCDECGGGGRYKECGAFMYSCTEFTGKRECECSCFRWEKCKRCEGLGRKRHPILSHLRSPGPHVRGCWALDLLLNKS